MRKVRGGATLLPSVVFEGDYDYRAKQHPGEKGDSHFPDGGQSVPRSAVVAVRRDDGKPVG